MTPKFIPGDWTFDKNDPEKFSHRITSVSDTHYYYDVYLNGEFLRHYEWRIDRYDSEMELLRPATKLDKILT